MPHSFSKKKKQRDHHHHLFIKNQDFKISKKKKSCIHFQTRGIRLCLISANSIRANQDKFKLVLQDLIRLILNLSHSKFPHDQKIPITKIRCPKNSHDKNHMSKKIPQSKHTWPKKFSQPMPHHNKKINAPSKFHHNQNFLHVHTQLPNFSITMHKKFPTCPR